MRNLLTLGLSLSLLALVGVSAVATQDCNSGCAGQGDGRPEPGPTDVEFLLSFSDADDTHSFAVEKAQKAGDLTVDTLDCCIPGDLWRVDLVSSQPNAATSGTGDGSITEFSGAATGHPWVTGVVTVSYDSGVDVFPAGMTVRFHYSQSSNDNTGMNITQID